MSAVRPVDDSYANGYGNSKWAGEVLLREANDLCGLPVSVFRCDMILADTTYAGQLNLPDMFTRMMFSLVATGIAPKSFYELDAEGNRQAAHYDGLPVEFIAEAIDTLGLERGPVVSVGFNSRGGYEAGRQLLADGDVPPALFVSSDRQAIGLLLAMHEAGVRVPDDVAIVGFDGAEDGEYSWPPLTTVAQPIEQMARTAVDLMIDGAGDDVNQVFPPTLLVRRSCGC